MVTETLVIPDDSQLSYLNEGAANVVYRIGLRHSTTPGPAFKEEYSSTTPPPSIIEPEDEEEADLNVFNNKLLRLRKDLKTTLTVRKSQEQWRKYVRPLFEENQVVHQELVALGKNTIQELNKGLRVRETNGTRLAKRAGVYLANDEYGLLVTDMTAVGTKNERVIEIKPKWLLQSPSAPTSAIRCRQCALTALRNQDRATKSPPEPLSYDICPLDLVSSNIDDVLYAANILLRQKSHPDANRFAKWIINSKLILRLRDLQAELDKKGPLKASPVDPNFRIAMTLRDCTLYIKLPSNDHQEIEARFGDLDVKSSEKGAYWRETEEKLIREGWYEGKERGAKQEVTCRLGRQFATKDRL